MTPTETLTASRAIKTVSSAGQFHDLREMERLILVDQDRNRNSIHRLAHENSDLGLELIRLAKLRRAWLGGGK